MQIKFYIIKISILILLIIIFTVKAFPISTLNICLINGTVKDSITGEVLPFASIQIFTQNESIAIKGVLTDINGNYTINDISPGKYRLIASYMGYNKKEVSRNIQKKNEKHNFSLSQKNNSLPEIVISTEKNLIEKHIEKITVNIAKNTTIAGGNAIDVMQTLPSIDVDIDGNINYRGSDKVIILLNGKKSELIKTLDQIPADQIEKVELINNPSAKYEAEGMSGIINIVLKKRESGNNKTTIMLNAGYPETFGGNVGYSKIMEKATLFINGGISHKTKYQTKEHLRENYENPNALNYYQFDRQDENLNSVFINTNFEYAINKKQHIGLSLISSKKFNSADRVINYETQYKNGNAETESLKEIDIALDNYTFDANVDYHYRFKNKGQILKANFHYTLLDQLHQMNNKYYSEINDIYSNPIELQNTFSKQFNKKSDLSLDYSHPLSDSILIETGYIFNTKDLTNDFYAENYSNIATEWSKDPSLTNKFNYIQQINAIYFNINAKLEFLEIQAGIRTEHTNNKQNGISKNKFIDFFPSINITRKLNNNFTVFAGYNRRINRPTIKMLNPYTNEYADILNMHRGNPDLNPKYVNSFEVGNRFIADKISGFGSIYYRDIDQAISRIKSASNDSALIVTFLNLEKAKLIGSEVAISYKPYKWWNINVGSNIFYTNLTGEYENNKVNNSRIGWNASISNKIKFSQGFGLQFSAYYRSKLPSVMGTYIERYYMDIAVNKKILKNKGQLIFKVSDIFNTYLFGLDLDAIDVNNYRYSQTNRRKNESRYFILSFIYNIDSKKQKKSPKENFFLDGFDK